MRSGTPAWLVVTVILVLVGGLAGAIAVAVGADKGGGTTAPEPDPEPIIAIAEPDDRDRDPAPRELPAQHPTLGRRAFSYTARLSEGDHLDAYGQQLVTAPAVLLRDRERLFGALAMGAPGPDDDDEADPAFRNADADARALFANAVAATLEPTVAHIILTHTPLVQVAVYEEGVLVQVLGEP